MHIFPALIGFDVTSMHDDKVLRNWDFPFIHCTVDGDLGCLEASVIMVYCAAFDCNANSRKNKVTCSWFKFSTETTSNRRSTAGFARFEKTFFDCDPDQRRCSPGLS